MTAWIDGMTQRPHEDGIIVVWGQWRDDDPYGAVAVRWNYGAWVDVVDGSRPVTFRWWMTVDPPKEPS